MDNPRPDWRRYFWYRKEVTKTTWVLRLSVVLFALFLAWITRGSWTLALGESVVCVEQAPPSDALLLENFDPDYLVFERAEALKRAGIASRLFVPVQAAGDSETPNASSQGIAEVLARVAHISNIELIPIELVEPISLNAARQIQDFLTKARVSSVLVVTPGFRSRRSLLVYTAVLAKAGIKVGCVPVFGIDTPRNWTQKWHGIEDVLLQFGKLQYYRFYVFGLRGHSN